MSITGKNYLFQSQLLLCDISLKLSALQLPSVVNGVHCLKSFVTKKKIFQCFVIKKFDDNVHQLQRNYCKIKNYQTGSSKRITPSYLFFLHPFLIKLPLFLKHFYRFTHNMSNHQFFCNSFPPFQSDIFHGNFFFSFNLKVTQKYLLLNIFILTCNFKNQC